MKNYVTIFKLFENNKRKLFVVCVLAVAKAVLFLVAALLLSNLLQAIIDRDFNQFIIYSVLDYTIFVTAIFSQYCYTRMFAYIKQSTLANLRTQIVKKLQQIDYVDFHKKMPESYSAMLVTDLEMVEIRILNRFFNVLSGAISFIVNTMGLLYLDIWILIITLALAIMMVVLPRLFHKKLEKSASNVAQQVEELVGHSNHWILGFDSLHNHNRKELIQQHIDQFICLLFHAKRKDGNLTAAVDAFMGMASVFCQVATIGLTGYLALLGRVVPGAILSTGNLVGSVFSQLNALIMHHVTMKSGFEVLNKIRTFVVIDESDSLIGNQLDSQQLNISTTDVVYQFLDGTQIAFPNMDLVMNKNYAIVGKSGVGKTIFLNVLVKNLKEYAGNLTLNTLELRDLTDSIVKSNVAYVESSTYIFNTTFKENVTLGDTSISDEVYQNAISLAGLKAVVDKWSNGDQTLLGNQGVQVSAGQAQRIGIARALVRQTTILIFDEITANLDKETAMVIEQDISRIPDKIKISVTHHLTEDNKKLYDKVIKFENKH